MSLVKSFSIEEIKTACQHTITVIQLMYKYAQ
jgi:hypothetical protein